MKFAFVLIIPRDGVVIAKHGYNTAKNAYRAARRALLSYDETLIGATCRVTAVQVPNVRKIDYSCLPEEIFHDICPAHP